MKILNDFFSPQLPDNIGDVHLEWNFKEYEHEAVNRTWYIVGAIVLAGLLAYSVFTANFLFAIILLLSVFVIIYQFFQAPREINVQIGEDGVIIDKRYYPYKELKNFWIIYEPPVYKYLYIDFKSDIKGVYPVPLSDENPLKVREFLLKYIDEDIEKEEAGFDEAFSKLIKFR
ncbi:hypothetical protein HN958_02335 [Candidatus Falkowbacteria bacterium]|jgi:hypothetical protein|nr:hypothetical protein [Candidatus Falkowbacteria bacterium]